jgi:anti-anti-sigma factor
MDTEKRNDPAQRSARIMTEERLGLVHTRLESHGDTIVVIASGEIDLSCAGRLEAQLRGLLGCARRLVVDLSGVQFMDPPGLRCLLAVDRAGRAAGVELTIVPGPPQVQRLFEITKTDETLHFTRRPATNGGTN